VNSNFIRKLFISLLGLEAASEDNTTNGTVCAWKEKK
jgi:hypothetical protein